MFKAKFIEHTDYYKIKIYLVLTGIVSFFLIHFSQWYIGWSIMGFIIFVFGSLMVALIQKGYGDQLNLFSGNKKIEISENAIKILNKKKEVLQLYDISKVKEITILDQYKMHGENLKDLLKPRNNFLILQMEEEEIRLDFEIDSYYGIKQLEKVIDCWKKNGISLRQIIPQLMIEK